MMKYLIIDGKLLFIALTVIMAYYIYKKYENVFIRVIGVIPLIGATFFNIFRNHIAGFFPSLNILMNLYSKDELIINESNVFNETIYIPMIIYFLILFSILINIYLIFKDTNQWKLVIIIYGIGVASRLIMGFSPTVFASAERTSIFLYTSFIIISILIYRKLLEENQKTSNLLTMYIFISLLNSINSMVSFF